MLNWLQPQLSFKELAVVSVGPAPSTRGSIPLLQAQVCVSVTGKAVSACGFHPPLPVMSHFLWHDAHHLRETASVLGMSRFILPVPARVDTEGHQALPREQGKQEAPNMTFSCPYATLDRSFFCP